MRHLRHLLSFAALAALGCDDSSSSSGVKPGDMNQPTPDGPVSSDMAVTMDEGSPRVDGPAADLPVADVSVSIDTPQSSPPDLATPDVPVLADGPLPDLPVPDVYLPTAPDAGPACAPGGPGEECGPFSTCIDGTCTLDLRRRTFRINDADVLAPVEAEDSLDDLFRIALAANVLHLLVEPNGYTPEGYQFFVGSGRPLVPSDLSQGFLFNHELPVQDIRGDWRIDRGAPVFRQSADALFRIFAPGSTVLVDNVRQTCWTEIAFNARISVSPSVDDAGAISVRAEVEGYMTVAAANQVVFSVGGIDLPLAMYLAGAAPLDLDGDGEEAEYPFHIAFTGGEILLDDPNMERSPDVVPSEPEECNQ